MIDKRLAELGIKLAGKSSAFGSYVAVTASENLIFVSGQLPVEDGKLCFEGKLGADLLTEQGYKAARVAALNGLSAISHFLGDINRLGRIIKVTGYVASSSDFTEQHKVVNGASEFFTEILSEKGRHSRVAVGVPSLPMNSPVEIEIIAEVISSA